LEEINKERLALMHKLDEAFRDVRKQILSEWNKNNEHNLGMTHGRMLILLNDNGAMKASALAEALSITGGGVTGIADRLIELGYIKRERSQEDRRAVLLTLSDKGKAGVGSMMEVRRNIMIKLFKGLSIEDMLQGIHLFQTMSQNMESQD
jgi:DNA-binding MarR family transcriptional regulator